MKAMLRQLRSDLAVGRGSLDPLLLAARVLLYVLMVGLILAIVVSIVSLLVFLAASARDLGQPLTAEIWDTPGRIVLRLVALGLLNGIVVRLLAMIGTVERQESFAPDNARRIEQIAGSILGLQLIGFFGRMIGIPLSGHVNGLAMGIGLSPGGIAIVLLLFILARVFRQGAGMREDLQGTV